MADRSQPTLGGLFDDEPGYRLFLGLWPDAAAAERLAQLMARLRRDEIMPGRPVDVDRLHLTLHHLGDFVDQIPPSLAPSAQAAAARLKAAPFEIAFDRVGGTGPRLLLRATEGSTELVEFRQSLTAALIKAGLRRQIVPTFNPHITLSYDPSDAPLMFIEPIRWTVREFRLVESLLGQHKHIERGVWPLAL
jgi:2'-5' RNA ligase